MLSLRFPRLWLGVGWLAVALAIRRLPDADQQAAAAAQLERQVRAPHLLPAAVVLVCRDLSEARYWIIAAGCAVMGVLIEFAQGAMHFGRQADPYDVLANCTGILIGLLLSWWWLGGWAQRVESVVESLVTGTRSREPAVRGSYRRATARGSHASGFARWIYRTDASVRPGQTALRRMLEGGHLHSMILWGPPGTGKTTLARLVAQQCDAQFIALLGGDGRCERYSSRGRASAGSAPSRPSHRPVSGRGASFQQSAAGCLSAVGRRRHASSSSARPPRILRWN